ncbi:MAG: hypothetical protein U0835_21315 [Isosphaeraceae bacterium]
MFSLRTLTPGTPLGLAFALILSAQSPVLAQSQSSGSGPGTGTGSMGGTTRNTTGTGEEGGPGRSPTGSGYQSGAGPSGLPSNTTLLPGERPTVAPPGPAPRINPEEAVAPGPGVGVTFPDDEGMMPLGDLANSYSGPALSALAEVTEIQLNYARRIPSAGDRSLALSRIASAATFSNQLDMADTALIDAYRAALQMTPGMVQDQRLISIVTALMGLGEARLREGKPDALGSLMPPAASEAPGGKPAAQPALPAKPTPVAMMRLAQADFRRAGDLAARINNETYRTELMYRVAEAMSFGSQSIVNEYPRAAASGEKGESTGLDTSYEGLPDQFLQEATRIASRIERPVWHDQALVRVATAAAESRQFERAIRIAREIPQPEVRSNALIKIAEVEARRGDPKAATQTYHEAALAIASIVQEDPRAVLAGVLIDNLVAVGRFEDARASVALYPDEPRKRIALGAIAEAMGSRGAGYSALQWINNEAPADYRSQLYRRVNNGVVTSIQLNRSRAQSKQ